MCVHVRVRKGVLPKVERPLVVSFVNVSTEEAFGQKAKPKKPPSFQFGRMFSDRKRRLYVVSLFAFIATLTFYFAALLYFSLKELFGHVGGSK